MQLETSTSHCQTKTLCHTRPGTVLHRQILWTKSLTAGSQMIRNGSCRLHPLYNEMGYFHVHLTLIWMERKVNFAFSNKRSHRPFAMAALLSHHTEIPPNVRILSPIRRTPIYFKAGQTRTPSRFQNGKPDILSPYSGKAADAFAPDYRPGLNRVPVPVFHIFKLESLDPRPYRYSANTI